MVMILISRRMRLFVRLLRFHDLKNPRVGRVQIVYVYKSEAYVCGVKETAIVRARYYVCVICVSRAVYNPTFISRGKLYFHYNALCVRATAAAAAGPIVRNRNLWFYLTARHSARCRRKTKDVRG